MEVRSFVADGVEHSFERPLAVTVELDGRGQVYLGTVDGLGLCVHAESRDELAREVLDDLAWRWSAIATASEDELAPDAVAVRRTFLDLVAG